MVKKMEKIIALFLFAALLMGCTSDSGTTEQTTSQEAQKEDGPKDMSGTITTTGYADCLDLCDSGGPGTGPYCKDGCRFEQAENTKDTGYCDQLDQKESIPECYGTVAIAAGDIKICDSLPTQEDRNHCVSAFSPR
jgi:hypothetical protein